MIHQLPAPRRPHHEPPKPIHVETFQPLDVELLVFIDPESGVSVGAWVLASGELLWPAETGDA